MKRLLTLLLGAFAVVACTQNEALEITVNRDEAPETLTIGFDGGNDTRIQLNEAQKTVWNEGDLVSVFYRSDANQKWQFQGETGDRIGNVKRVENAVGTTRTTKNVVVYPYSEDYWLNTDSYFIDAMLPDVQHYAVGSYGVGENLMVSQSEFTQFSLKNVCGWLKVQFTGDSQKVVRLTLRGNNEEQMAGLIYVDTATAESTLAAEMGSADDNNAGENTGGGAGGNLVFDDTIVTELTLDCGEGVVLGEETTSFFFTIPPQTFANGVTLEVVCEDGAVMTLSTNKEFVIERNHIQPMEVVAFKADESVSVAGEIIYWASEQIVNNVSPWSDDTFGAKIKSHTFDQESGKGVISFYGNVTRITNQAFKDCNALTGIYFPKTVTSITNEAFVGCGNLDKVYIDNLDMYYALEMDHPSSGPLFNQADLYVNNELFTEWEIPSDMTTVTNRFLGCTSLSTVILHDSIEKIEDSAFYMCDNLKKVYINTLDSWYNIEFPDEWSRPQRGGADVYVNNELFTEWIVPINHEDVGQWFRGCGSLERVVIHDAATIIGSSALASCQNLKYVDWGGVVRIDDWAFFDCKSFTNITFNNNLEIIRTNAFRECTNLESVTFGNKVREIHHLSFMGCTKLSSVTFGNQVTLIDGEAFTGCNLETVVLPASLNYIGVKAFNDNANLTTVYCAAIIPPTTDMGNQGDLSWFGFGNSVERIYVPAGAAKDYKEADGWKEYADKIIGYDFICNKVVESSACNEIWYTADEKIEFNADKADVVAHTFSSTRGEGCIFFLNRLTKIGDEAFAECSNLESVIIPEYVTEIGAYAFASCESLTSVTIPDSVTTIGNEAFSDCDSLAEFNGKFAEDNGRILVIDGTLVAFAPAGITEYTIPDSVTTIGESAFYSYHSLTSVTIPNSVMTIEYNAFNSCLNLASVTMGDSITMIGHASFVQCKNLESVYIKTTTPPSLDGSQTFIYVDETGGVPEIKKLDCNFYVPAESVSAYKTAEYWSEYADSIVGYDFENNKVVE